MIAYKLKSTKIKMQNHQPFTDLFEQRRESVLATAQDVAKKIAKEVVDTEMDLFEFELFNSAAISEEQSQKTTEEVRKIRSQRWQESIEKSNGNKERALSYF